MQGDPTQFEAIGSRLGVRIDNDSAEELVLIWRGPRFPAFLCLGIALALLFLSVPIAEAIRERGFSGPAGSLWYFPMMNLILLGISLFLLSLKRTIVFDNRARRITLYKSTIFRRHKLTLDYDEVTAPRLGTDQVYSGFAVAGSSAAVHFPVPSLRLMLDSGQSVLLDRGGAKRLGDLGNRLGALLEKPLRMDLPR
jgi:hypothetical protein